MISGLKLICGVGVNDADYKVNIKFGEKRVWCKIYLTWKNMISRCYSESYQSRQPSYIGCKVCAEWLLFSNFRKWMITQNWQGRHLDKDILIGGNKVYSPETCVFVSGDINCFLLDSSASRGKFPIGVSRIKNKNVYESYCRNPFTGKKENLGYFNCPEEAHQAWRKRKHQLACQLANLQDDQRVAAALKSRYLP